MTHISNGTEYSLHCLLYLVERRDGVAPSARDLAEFQGISVSYVAKLFTKLEKSGLVIASEGVRGGFQLARPAEEISVLQVVDAVEGDKPLFDCKEIRANCVLFQKEPLQPNEQAPKPGDVCSIHAVMLRAEQAMRQTLADTSLTDIANTVASKVSDHHQLATVDWFAKRVKGRSPGSRTSPTNKN